MNINVTDLITAVFAIIVTVITYHLIPYVKNRIGEQQFANIQLWVRTGVAAAEQIFKQSGKGAEKKAYVLQFLKDLGIDLDVNVLNGLIESAVLELKQWGEIK